MDGFTDRALAVLAIIATTFLLHWGAPFFIPLAVSIIIAFALSPVVDALTRVLRSAGVMRGVIGTGQVDPDELVDPAAVLLRPRRVEAREGRDRAHRSDVATYRCGIERSGRQFHHEREG